MAENVARSLSEAMTCRERNASLEPTSRCEPVCACQSMQQNSRHDHENIKQSAKNGRQVCALTAHSTQRGNESAGDDVMWNSKIYAAMTIAAGFTVAAATPGAAWSELDYGRLYGAASHHGTCSGSHMGRLDLLGGYRSHLASHKFRRIYAHRGVGQTYRYASVAPAYGYSGAFSYGWPYATNGWPYMSNGLTNAAYGYPQYANSVSWPFLF
jgi:hypothetical protein